MSISCREKKSSWPCNPMFCNVQCSLWVAMIQCFLIFSLHFLLCSLSLFLYKSLKDSVSSSVHSMANELSYWNRKESVRCCRKCCHGKPHWRRGVGNYLLGQRNMRMSFHQKMYQFRLMLGRLQPFSLPLHALSSVDYLTLLTWAGKKQGRKVAFYSYTIQYIYM